MRSLFRFIPLLLLTCSVHALAQEVNLNEWGKEYTKVMTGARDSVQYSIYHKAGTDDKVYLEFWNRNTKDVKVSLNLVGKGVQRGTPIPMTAFIKAGGYWPNGFEKAVACPFQDPDIEIVDVTTGEVDMETVIEVDSDGKQSERYKYKFKSDADLKREKEREKDKK